MDSPEYKILSKYSPDLVSCIGQSPDDIFDQLRPLDILAQGDMSFLGNLKNTSTDKARKIVNVVLTQVKTDPQMYCKLIRAMKASGGWTKATVCKLEKEYGLLLAEIKQHCLEENRQSGEQYNYCNYVVVLHGY